MTAYIEQTAQIFDGVRLDNCHSTPIPIAEVCRDSIVTLILGYLLEYLLEYLLNNTIFFAVYA